MGSLLKKLVIKNTFSSVVMPSCHSLIEDTCFKYIYILEFGRGGWVRNCLAPMDTVVVMVTFVVPTISTPIIVTWRTMEGDKRHVPDLYL